MKKRTSLLVGLAVAFNTFALASADVPKIPAAAPLSNEEIKALLDGKRFAFTGYDQPITGTTTWNATAGIVSGVYSWQGGPDTPYEAKWTIEGGKNCTESPEQQPVCQTIYRHEDGFMEVNADGQVHAVSKPKP